jgi:small redox-active disulfide protein 2
MEYWVVGVLTHFFSFPFSITPGLHRSSTPNRRTISYKGERKVEIKVLGPGCPRCQQTEKHVKEAVAEAGVEANIEKVTDTMKIAKYGVFGTPALVVDGEVKSVGKIPSRDEIKSWICK